MLIQKELDKLNQASTEINRLENELDVSIGNEVVVVVVVGVGGGGGEGFVLNGNIPTDIPEQTMLTDQTAFLKALLNGIV